MRRKSRGFDPFRFARSTEGQLVIGFFVLLYVVGGGLIWYFYGVGGATAGLGLHDRRPVLFSAALRHRFADRLVGES